MTDELFDTPQKIEQALAGFKSLVNHPGWILYEKIVRANIEIVKDQLLHGSDDDTKESIALLRKALVTMENDLSVPADTIKRFESPIDNEVDYDPYDKLENPDKKDDKSKT